MVILLLLWEGRWFLFESAKFYEVFLFCYADQFGSTHPFEVFDGNFP